MMNFATRKFELPFETSDPITFPINMFWYKTTYDKYYIVDFREPISRFELALMAVKNAYRVQTQKSIAMNRRSTVINYRGWNTVNPEIKEAPAYFGMPLGRCIPVMKAFRHLDPKIIEGSLEQEQEFQRIALEWTNEFFEVNVDWWFEVLPSTSHNEELTRCAKSGRAVWAGWHMEIMWIPQYQQLVSEGLQTNVAMEQSLNSISEYINDEAEVCP